MACERVLTVANMSTHFYGDGCDADHGAPCDHPSATGIDQATGPEKVWRCDVCGWLYRSVRDETGIDHMVAVS